jgi:hypothetical protein
MKKIVSFALAGTLAMSAIAVSASGASADGRHHYHRPPPPRSHYDPGAAIAAGAIFGLAAGALLNPYPAYPAYDPPPPPPPYYPAYSGGAYPDYALQAHIRWCLNTYDTYDARTDTWTDYRGVVRACEGP